ncbi:ABC transporter permease [Faecalicatena contorta]|uniref:ABC transporter permease n=1 Tax=Faecalicatena contorta TaxID=39482 RepID=UPI0031D87978
MSKYLQNFRKFRPLLEELVARDIKIKYRKSVLGVLWTLLNPLLMMIVLTIVFSNLFKFDIENYPIYLLSGQLVFNFFNESTSNAMSAILGNSSLIKKIYVPKYLFVLSRILSSVVNLAASFLALILLMLAMRVELHWTIIFFIFPTALLIVFSLGVSLLLAALVVKFRDIMHLYSVFTTALLYLTPVIYSITFLPEKIRMIVMINPITNYVIMFRDAMMYGRISSISSIVLGVVEAVIMLLIGLRVFYKMQDEFILNI